MAHAWGHNMTRPIHINIGAGKFFCEGWTNLDYPSKWYQASQKETNFIPFDIRQDALPFETNSVDTAYCSHVIEHIELEFVQKLLAETLRVLKKGGVLRISCPDAEWLYTATKKFPAYWECRKELLSGRWLKENQPTPTPLDFLVRDVATTRCRQYIYASDPLCFTVVEHNFSTLPMVEFLDFLTEGLRFIPERPGEHIQWFSYKKIQEMLKQNGFSTVIQSRYSGSIVPIMQNKSVFDVTCPEFSLYVEAIK